MQPLTHDATALPIAPFDPNSEFEFVLPKGLIDASGHVHQHGRMRLATAKDEISVQRHRQAQTDPAYATLVMLSRVITQLGTVTTLTPDLLENLFSRDLAYLREFYNRINQHGDAFISVECPDCNHHFSVELVLAGES